MKRNRMWSAVGLALGLSWTSVAMAQGAGGAGGDGTPLSQHRVEGRVVSVDAQQRSFEIGVNEAAHPRATRETKTLTVAPNAHIIRDGLNVPFAELKPGDEVRAAFLSDDLARSRPWEIEARSPRGREVPWGVTHGG